MNKWIDVKFELPTETTWVLVYGDGAITCRGFSKKYGIFEDWENCGIAGLDMKEITHWMPLPDPPKTYSKEYDDTAVMQISNTFRMLKIDKCCLCPNCTYVTVDYGKKLHCRITNSVLENEYTIPKDCPLSFAECSCQNPLHKLKI